MNQEPKCKINLGKPIVLLNGLVTDKNNYTDEQKLEMLNSKKSLKNKIPKNPCIIYHASKEQNNNDIMPLSEEEHNENIIEENDNENIIQDKIDINEGLGYKINLSNKDEDFMKKNKKNKTENKRGRPRKNKNEKIELTHFNSDKKNEESSSNSKIKIDNLRKSNKKRFSSQKKVEDIAININYKEVPKADTYEDITKLCKNNSCAYVSLLNPDLLKKLKLEDISQILFLYKRMKKEKKENIIISNGNNEMKITKTLIYLLKEYNPTNLSLFKKISPDNNNILQHMPVSFSGINNYEYMLVNNTNNIGSNNNIHNKNETEIHFITNFFNDKNSGYALFFRKYIINLSCFKSNEYTHNENDYNIYHIIIPKKSVNKINININEETSLKSLIQKLNCEYYFYCQRPGELLVVEPESILLSYYYKENSENKGNDTFYEKNYLLMFWNKMNVESFSDYLILQNFCKNEKYRNLPIVNALLNLVNKSSNALSDDIIKIILEIYNEFDNYENINDYIDDINENNIRFHKLYLNDVYLCEHCGQEIFNFYVYDTKENYNIFKNGNNNCNNNLILENDYLNNNNSVQKTGKFICVKCAKNKDFFKVDKNIIFFKYTKEEVNNLILSINRKINRPRNKDKNEIISDKFYGKRNNDCINVDEFLLKIDGPCRILDNGFQKNKNALSIEDIHVDKYLKLLSDEKDKNKNKEDFEPLNPINFRNGLTKNDLYEIYEPKSDYSFENKYEIFEPKVINIISGPINNNENGNYAQYHFNDNEIRNSPRDNYMDIEKEKEEKEKENESVKNNANIQGSKKNKKKNCTNLQDIIFSGEF